jgi:hypothetical protein
MSDTPPAPSRSLPAGSPVPGHDDMHDPPEFLGRRSRLGDYLRFCQAELLPKFQAMDAASLASQRLHRAFARWAAVTTTAAALFALTRRFLGPRLAQPGPRILHFLEGAGVVVTLLLVIVGLLLIGHTRWLMRRYQAEQIRLLKFRLLTDPSFWAAGATGDGWKDHLREERDSIVALPREKLGALSEAERVPAVRDRGTCDAVGRETLAEVVDYYMQRRLAPQRDYFGRAADHAEVRFLKSPLLVPALFFLGLLATLVDWLVGIGTFTPEKVFGALGVGALAFAGILPVVWRGIRGYRGANEFSRNASRSTARKSALSELEARLRSGKDPSVIFAELAFCEYILGADQQEWLRLMRGAKWYG